MTLSTSDAYITVGVYLLLSPNMSNAEFFQRYGLIESGHLNLNASTIEKLEKYYEKCVSKFNSLDKNVHNDQFPKNLDIPSHSGILDLSNPSHFKAVQLWPVNTIPTEFDDSLKTGSYMKRLACAITYFHIKTCIRFIKKKEHHKNYLFISNNGLYCSSDEVGVKGGKQTVILGLGATDCWRHGTIIHELMHVIGLFHEHQRHDRDEHIDIIQDNIHPSDIKQFQTIEEMGYQNYRDIGEYDFSSIMHYGSKFGDDRVMVAKFSKYKHKAYDFTDKMGNRLRPTDTDTSKVNELYQCAKSTTTNCEDQMDCADLDSLCTISEVIRKKCERTCGLCDKNRSIKVLLIGGGYPIKSSMEYYYPYQSQYNSLINVTMIKPRGYHTSVVMNDGKIMTMGGYGYDVLKNVEIFNPITNTLTKGPNMNKARGGCDSAIINGIVYVCGGQDDGYNGLSSCESYQSGVWEYIAPMHKVRNKLRLISLNGYLYAIGGQDGNKYLNSVEKYNPQSNSWMMVKSMQTPRGDHGAAVLNGFIYVCGGYEKHIHSCERYDPALNKWSNITKTIIYRRNGLSMVSDGQLLFAFGGWKAYDAWSSVEMYDPKKDKWILLKKTLIHDRYSSSAVVLH